ncbi:type II toxin-antitoxin system Phd/YefM family antitoxin [Fulvivirgaceae bacterium BMA12]|uniref:Antitoxin n=1 Tax=Agaribacillus aureus TaxID=3051825 RepID=A0ABT8L6V3_9BACT|nr:type II toxin-antitoxin system Phd/YefM family antitoxin [Fulvivirgaceae bacterium BMA12]
MKTTTVADLRKNFKSKMDQIYEDHDILIINRQGDKDMVMLSLRDFNALRETAYLLSTEANTKRLLESMDQLKNQNVIRKHLNDL